MQASENITDRTVEQFYNRVFGTLVALAAAIGLLDIVGWLAGIRFLTSLRSDYFPMPPSTALAILLTCAVLVLVKFPPTGAFFRILTPLASLVLVVFSGEVLFEFLAGIEPGMEARVFGIEGHINGIPVGRMSPIAAAVFLLLNLGVLLLLLNRSRQDTVRIIAACLGIVVLIVGSATVLGYLYGTPLLYGGSTRPVAPTASAAFAMLGAALTVAAGTGTWPLKFFVGPEVRAQMLRTFTPIVLALIVVSSWLNIYVPDHVDINPVYVSAFSAIIFIILAAFFVVRSAQKIGGAVDRANEQRARAEAMQRKTMAELKRSNIELEQFAYVASHDLQEPLRMISSYLQLLEKRYGEKLDQDAKEFIAFAVDGANRMQLLINDLLSLSRVETKGKPFALTSFEKVLGSVTANLQVAIEESHAEVTHGPLPNLMADPSQMIQLLQNMVGNAIKFRGQEPPHIHVAAEKSDGEWIFSVADNGIGFDPAYTEKIFIIFKRLHGRHEYSGTGIGLAVSKKIVERHGGRIWAEGRPDQGATFYFSIPQAQSTPH